MSAWLLNPDLPRLGATLRIPKRFVDVERVRDDLSVDNPSYWQQRAGGQKITVEPTIQCWSESERFIYVPRHYAPPWRGGAPHVVDARPTPGAVDAVEHRITPRGLTQIRADEALRATTGDKIISLACGKGKTVVSLYSASEGERFPLLVVVHTNALMDQWKENYNDAGELVGGIKFFYGLQDREIGHIQGKICDWRGKQVAIAMLNTLVLKKFEPAFYRYWRTIIFDEVHRLGAQFFQKAAAMFPGERWGLSATVSRPDKMDKVFRMHLGQVVYEDKVQDLQPKTYFISTGISAPMSKFMLRSGRVNTGRLYTYLSEHEERNKIIAHYIREAAARGRTSLILGERLSQLHEMAEALREEGLDTSVHVGSMDQDERREALTHKTVFATQHLAKEGLDRPAFDTLFVIIPFGGAGRLEQSIGRILRLHGGKKGPKVFVFVDSIGIMQALAAKMKRALKGLRFEFFVVNPMALMTRLTGDK